MQAAAIVPGGDLAVGAFRLLHRKLFRQIDDAVQTRPIEFEAFEIHARQRNGGDLAGAQQLRQFHRRRERQLLDIAVELRRAHGTGGETGLLFRQFHARQARLELGGRLGGAEIRHPQPCQRRAYPREASGHRRDDRKSV